MNTAPNKKEKNSATAMNMVVDRKKNNEKKRPMTTASGVTSGNADFELDNQQRTTPKKSRESYAATTDENSKDERDCLR